MFCKCCKQDSCTKFYCKSCIKEILKKYPKQQPTININIKGVKENKHKLLLASISMLEKKLDVQKEKIKLFHRVNKSFAQRLKDRGIALRETKELISLCSLNVKKMKDNIQSMEKQLNQVNLLKEKHFSNLVYEYYNILNIQKRIKDFPDSIIYYTLLFITFISSYSDILLPFNISSKNGNYFIGMGQVIEIEIFAEDKDVVIGVFGYLLLFIAKTLGINWNYKEYAERIFNNLSNLIETIVLHLKHNVIVNRKSKIMDLDIKFIFREIKRSFKEKNKSIENIDLYLKNMSDSEVENEIIDVSDVEEWDEILHIEHLPPPPTGSEGDLLIWQNMNKEK
jgi:hypothetical protein